MNRAEHRARGTPNRLARLLPLAAAWLVATMAVADDDRKPPSSPVLHLADGGYVAGTLVASPDAGSIRWQAAAFVEPLDFPAPSLDSIRWPLPATPPEPEGDVGVELTAGDVLFGTLVALDEEALTLDTERFGPLHVARDRVRRIHHRRDAADLVYFGPNGLSGWTATPDATAWRDQAGQPATSRPGAAFDGDIRLPERAAVEVELSWERKPDFVLALGTSDDDASRLQAFRLELWADQLVAVRETERRADLAAIAKLAEGPGHVHLRLYLDQPRGRFLVETTDGRRVGDLTVPGDEPRVGSRIHLANGRGDVRLERLVVRRWDGELPPEVPANAPCLVRDDGSVVPGTVTRYDADSGEFSLVVDEQATSIPAAEVAVLVFAPVEDRRPRGVGLAYQDGTRLSGTLEGTGPEALALAVPGIEGVLKAPVAGLRSLAALDRRQAEPDAEAPTGLLELADTRLRGRLVDAEARPGASCLAWRPASASSSSRLRPGVSGKIVYKVPPPKPDLASGTRAMGEAAVAQGFVGAIRLNRATPRGASTQAQETSQPRLLYLRSGDIVPAEVTAIDEDGVTFRSPISENTTVTHERVQAATLSATAAPPSLPDPKRERLLTLPRIQQANPPTHLIRSRNGDFLRGRLLRLDGEFLGVEVRLSERRIPRDRVAEIIWLHPEAEGEEAALADGDEPRAEARVQALRSDGVRLTFTPQRVSDSTLSGRSDVLGTCRVPLAEVDQVLIGTAIEASLAEQSAHQWALRDALIPKAFQDDATSGGLAGTESALVGRPAPDFTLDLLDGTPFTLADHRGEIVILDFWATWCGPCLQAMPQVERVAAEFRDRGVRLVGVNLQESPEVIRPMLERHRFGLTVALDRDGVAAARYGVTAIPQTVVIDREGNVARLFVGGGAQLGDQLRAALEELLDETAAP